MKAERRLPYSVLALALVALLTSQVGTNIRIAVQESEGTLSDRAAFYTTFIIGALLLGRKHLHLVRWKTLLLALAFVGYVLILVTFTTNEPARAYIFPNYGILSWMALGVTSSLSVSAVSSRIAATQGKGFWPAVVWVPPLALVSVFFALREYALEPGRLDSYQFPAANLIVLLIFGLLALDAWLAAIPAKPGPWLGSMPPLAFAVLGTALSYLVSRMNSTAIVAVWVLLAAGLIGRFALSSGWRGTMLFIPAIVFAAYVFSGSSVIEEFFEETRFGELHAAGLLELSSVSTRAEILSTFWKQFEVSPVFGHMQAEVVAGFPPGTYVHNLALSALTHTGLIGSGLLLLSIFFAADIRRNSDHGYFPILLFMITVGCAIAFAFFTWIPLWFMLGYMSVKSRRVQGG